MRIAGVFDRFTISNINPRPGNVLISITEPNSEFPSLKKGWEDVLRLKLRDTENNDSITTEQAIEILDFVVNHQDKYIFINCDAGLSRSAGIRVALEFIFNHRDVSLNYPLHNKHIRDKIIETFYKRIWNGR